MARLRTQTARRSSGATKSVGPTSHGQVVLVLQGGGALGAYQAGVYEALHEAGIEPDWVIGTSIGAINGALIAGNPPDKRLERLGAFWNGVEQNAGANVPEFCLSALGNAVVNLMTMAAGIPSFFTPNPMALFGQHALLGIENAAYYTTAPLRHTLARLVDLDYINGRHTRISLGAVKIRSGEMSYFDSRNETIAMEHIMASGALPPAFPAIRVKDDFYWDGGIYSNTPLEAVLDDHPRHDSLIFTVDVWNPEGPVPETLWQVAGREKDIQYASRAISHIARQKQIHHLRHVILELVKTIPDKVRDSPEIKELASWGCKTTMHVVRLVASSVASEDHMKDIDFTPARIRARWQAGYADTRRMLDLAPWTRPVDPIEGIIIHDDLAGAATPLAEGVDGFEGKTK
ncbi:patatin-like phospholipase family protein [Undibacterium arcticum]|uniref:Patatin-like phospholipase family protein n=1 Tax=Undibacterium arcticum TaxID=1762892 RepID=A0ABV7F5I1_9BURK